jgi:hypothetical protein
MRILVSVMALAIALMWPAAGEAQSKKRESVKSPQQSDVRRHAKVHVARPSTVKPCAARTWAGCQGWDPDPNVRSMIQMDAGRDDR